MSEQNPVPTPADIVPQDPESTSQGDPADKPLGPNGEKALQSERAARKAAEESAAAALARVKAFEDAQKSDAERAAEALTEAKQAAATAATEVLRWRTAAKFGISDEDAETFLTGSDEATITRQAERLAALASAPTTPRPDLTQANARPNGAGGTPESDFASFLKTQIG